MTLSGRFVAFDREPPARGDGMTVFGKPSIVIGSRGEFDFVPEFFAKDADGKVFILDLTRRIKGSVAIFEPGPTGHGALARQGFFVFELPRGATAGGPLALEVDWWDVVRSNVVVSPDNPP